MVLIELAGSIAHLSTLTSLKKLRLENNRLEGVLPIELIRLKGRGCAMHVSANDPGFRLPGNLEALGDDITFLDLSNCSLSGKDLYSSISAVMP